MTLIDTSAWIEFLRRNGCAEVKHRVAAFLDMNVPLYSCDPHFTLIRDKGNIPLHLG